MKLSTIKHRTEKKPKRKLSQEAKDRKNLRKRLLDLWSLIVKQIAQEILKGQGWKILTKDEVAKNTGYDPDNIEIAVREVK